MSSYQSQDLASILQTLSAYTPNNAGAASTQYHSQPGGESLEGIWNDRNGHGQLSANAEDEDDAGYDPGDPMMQERINEHIVSLQRARQDLSYPLTTNNSGSSQAPLRQQTLNQPATQPKVDSSAIVEWPAAVRHVTRLAAQNEALGRSVQKMIKTQKEHERQWIAGRQALQQKQKDRVEGKRIVDETLRAIGAAPSSSSQDVDPEQELRTYDCKVHRASTEMVRSMSADLAAMGVPFFGTRTTLIVDEKASASEDDMAKSLKAEQDGRSNADVAEKKTTIRKDELLALQRRMLQHLEDLFSE